MSELQLRLLTDTSGRARRLYVYDGTKLLGTLAATYVNLRAFDAGRAKPVLAVEFPEAAFTVDIEYQRGRVLLFESRAAFEEAPLSDMRDAVLVGYRYAPGGPPEIASSMVCIVKNRYGGERSVSPEEWDAIATEAMKEG